MVDIKSMPYYDVVVQEKWMPVVGGTLVFILGILEILASFFLIICIPFFQLLSVFFKIIETDVGFAFPLGIFISLIFLWIITGILGIIGGLYAIKREKWKLALSSSVFAGIIPVLGVIVITEQLPRYFLFIFLTGIISFVLIISSKSQFKSSQKQ
jgi:hypothetical protein